jgi:mRNA-degrading endonuclease RelE of RelBE toxin-antitoxin system
MNYKILSTEKFDKALKRLSKKYPSLKIDIRSVLELLTTEPEQGVSLGKNCYKIRVAIKSKGRGKSAGARLITHIHISGTAVILLTIYDKSEKADLSDEELSDLLDGLIDG